jgi:hypothetical protein
VLEEDVCTTGPGRRNDGIDAGDENDSTGRLSNFIREQNERIVDGETPLLFIDEDFPPTSSSIDGIHKKSMFSYILNIGNAREHKDNDEKPLKQTNIVLGGTAKKPPPPSASASVGGVDNVDDETQYYPKCYCNRASKLTFRQDGTGKAYFQCGNIAAAGSGGINPYSKTKRCKYFSWAFQSESMPWYRFGQYNHHTLVNTTNHKPTSATLSSQSSSSFAAQDLVQGKVGDCWFLSALAVIAERPDLIQRLFQQPSTSATATSFHDEWGIVQVNLFHDGFWTRIVMDNFLPCMLGRMNRQEEDDLKRAIEASLNDDGSNSTVKIRNPYRKKEKPTQVRTFGEGRRLCDGKIIAAAVPPSTVFGDARTDPTALAEQNIQIMTAVRTYLDRKRGRRGPNTPLELLDRKPESQDLAYSKARRNQLWVPFLEKAYAKIHGSYNAISGGHIAEAFLDLTGAPTLQIQWHRRNSHQDSCIYEPKTLWRKLLHWRSLRLPMGCGTDSSAVGIIGMHAYSILDVKEIQNVDVEFFKDQLVSGTLGNASGFTEYDGKVRLLRIRNPHGKVRYGMKKWPNEIYELLRTVDGRTIKLYI